MATISTSWTKRAETYDMLQWVKRDIYYETLLEELRLTGKEIVLDVGTGTGTIARCVQAHCRRVVGMTSIICPSPASVLTWWSAGWCCTTF